MKLFSIVTPEVPGPIRAMPLFLLPAMTFAPPIVLSVASFWTTTPAALLPRLVALAELVPIKFPATVPSVPVMSTSQHGVGAIVLPAKPVPPIELPDARPDLDPVGGVAQVGGPGGVRADRSSPLFPRCPSCRVHRPPAPLLATMVLLAKNC